MSTVQNSRKARRPLAYGLAAALALGGIFATGATNAAPLSVNQAALKEAVPENVVDVHRRYRSGHIVAGMALGIIGAAIAAHEYKRYHRRHYGYYHSYQPHYYYGAPSCIRRHGLVYCR